MMSRQRSSGNSFTVMALSHHQELRVWRTAIELAVAAHNCVETFERRHAISYGDQIRRAAVSVAANIAEGAARRSKREFLQHLYIARGSCAELQTLFVIVRRLALANDEQLGPIDQFIDSTSRMLTALIKAVGSAR